MKPSRLSLGLLVSAGLLTGQPSAWAHGNVTDQVEVLQEQQPSNAPGKTAVMLTVRYAPGQASPAHQHPGAVTVSYTHLTLPTTLHECRSRWSPYH